MLRRCAPFATDREKFLLFLVSLHNQAEAYGTRPSEILGLETPWGAWQLNEIALSVGRRVEKNVINNKPPFDGFSLPINRSGGFRSAKQMVRRKVKIGPDGRW